MYTFDTRPCLGFYWVWRTCGNTTERVKKFKTLDGARRYAERMNKQ
jgi:hypothetical protein